MRFDAGFFTGFMKGRASQSGEKRSDSLTLAYIGALTLIAVFTYGSHMVTSHIMGVQKESTQVSYSLGRQRGVVQQISFHAANYFHHGEEVDYNLLKNAIGDMESSQKYLNSIMHNVGFLDQALGKTSISSALYQTYYEAPYYLDRQLKSFLEKANEFSQFAKDDQDPKRKQTLDYISDNYTDYLMPALDAALLNYQKEAIQRIAQYYRIQFMSMVFIMILLTLEALLIFRPLVSRIKKYNALLLKQALEDELTGLSNRRAFMVRAEKELRLAIENQSPITFALVDLDKFKLVNDTYGHDVGDKVLQHFSKILQTSLRPQDLVGRVGGEEFAILLSETDQGGALKILERVRVKTEKTPCRYQDKDGKNAGLNYTTSMGLISLKPVEGQSVNAIMKEADEALYQSKEGGRNCISVASMSSHASVQSGDDVPDTMVVQDKTSSPSQA